MFDTEEEIEIGGGGVTATRLCARCFRGNEGKGRETLRQKQRYIF